MNIGTINFSDFTNLSSVTKTLCNRLIPTEITAKYIKEHGVIEADQERNMMSQELKNILNDFYRSFLNENLVKVHELDFKPLFIEMKKYLETKDNKEALEKAQDDMRKAIHDIFEAYDKYCKTQAEKAQFNHEQTEKMANVLLPELRKFSNRFLNVRSGCSNSLDVNEILEKEGFTL